MTGQREVLSLTRRRQRKKRQVRIVTFRFANLSRRILAAANVVYNHPPPAAFCESRLSSQLRRAVPVSHHPVTPGRGENEEDLYAAAGCRRCGQMRSCRRMSLEPPGRKGTKEAVVAVHTAKTNSSPLLQGDRLALGEDEELVAFSRAVSRGVSRRGAISLRRVDRTSGRGGESLSWRKSKTGAT